MFYGVYCTVLCHKFTLSLCKFLFFRRNSFLSSVNMIFPHASMCVKFLSLKGFVSLNPTNSITNEQKKGKLFHVFREKNENKLLNEVKSLMVLEKTHDRQCSCVYQLNCVYSIIRNHNSITMHPHSSLNSSVNFQALVYLNNSHININYIIITKQQAVVRIKHIIDIEGRANAMLMIYWYMTARVACHHIIETSLRWF